MSSDKGKGKVSYYDDRVQAKDKKRKMKDPILRHTTTPSNGIGLICKYCSKLYKSARPVHLKYHLAGEVDPHIEKCTGIVPEEVRDEAKLALSEFKKKRKTVGCDDGDSVSDVIASLFLDKSISFNVLQDPRLRNALTRIATEGISTLPFLDQPVLVEGSVTSFEEGMIEYMETVRRSWVTSGCTLILYHLNVGGSAKSLVAGLYSPEGFIFVRVSGDNKGKPYYTLEDVTTGLYSRHAIWPEDLSTFVMHQTPYICDCLYQVPKLADFSVTKDKTSDDDEDFMTGFEMELGAHQQVCVCHYFEVFSQQVFKTQWIGELVKESENLHDFITFNEDLSGLFYDRLKSITGGKYTILLSRFGMILEFKEELRLWLSSVRSESSGDLRVLEIDNTLIVECIEGDKFWEKGVEIMKALKPLMKIPLIMDTLVPTYGYVGDVLDEAASELFTLRDRQPDRFLEIWDMFVVLKKNVLGSDFSRDKIATFLHPSYIVNHFRLDVVLGTDDLDNIRKYYVVGTTDVDEGLLAQEVDVYKSDRNPFAQLSTNQFRAEHPVTLWKKYGDRFPILMACACKIFSAPVSCMSRQVEKLVSKLDGVDNYMLRLNAMMREEYKTAGGNMYQAFSM